MSQDGRYFINVTDFFQRFAIQSIILNFEILLIYLALNPRPIRKEKTICRSLRRYIIIFETFQGIISESQNLFQLGEQCSPSCNREGLVNNIHILILTICVYNLTNTY